MPEISKDIPLQDYDFSISFGDIGQLEICKGGACQDLSQEDFVQMLYTNGLDTDKDYQVVNDTHRGITNKVFTTDRVLGYIRRDKAWTSVQGERLEDVEGDLKKGKYKGSEGLF